MSIETKPRTTEQYDLPTHIKPQQRGFMNVYELDGTDKTPGVQVGIHQGDRQNTFQAQPHRGIYAFGPLSKNKSAFPLKMSRGMNRHADVAAKSLVEQSALVPDMTKLVFSDEGIVFYQPDNDYTTLVKTADEQPEASKIVTLTGDPETHVGRYDPEMGDIIYIVRNHDAALFLTPPYDDATATDQLREDNVQFATFEVTREQVEAMAAARRQAARSKESVDRRRIETIAKLGKLAGSRDTADEQVTAVSGPDSNPAAELSTTIDTTDHAMAEPTTEAINSIDHHDNAELDGQVTAEAVAPAATEVSTPEVKSSSSQALGRLRQARNDNTSSTELVATHDELADAPNTPQGRKDNTALSFDDANNRLARAVARRTKLGMFTRGKKREKLNRLIEATDKAYTRRAQVIEDIEVNEWRAENDSLTDAELADKLATSHKERADQYEQREYEEFRQIKALGKVSELHDAALERYAGLSRKNKVLVNLGVVAVLGAGGAAAGVAFGAAGGALMAGAKLYKSYAHNRAGLYGPRQERDKLAIYKGEPSEGRIKSRDQLRDEATRQRTQTRTERIANTDKVNRRARIGMVASALVLGGGIANHAGIFREAAEQVGNWWSALGADPTDTTPAITVPADAHIEFPRTEVKVIPGPSHVEVPATPNVPEFSADALRVDAGEGWYQTFNEIGVTNATEQANLLQKVGPELVRRGVAYQMADGSYGMSRPGALSKDVLELIQKSR